MLPREAVAFIKSYLHCQSLISYYCKNAYPVLASVFPTLKWVHDIIPHSPLGDPVDTAFSRNFV